MTAVAANELTLYDRGRIAPGAAADLVAFDFERIGDRSTFAEPGKSAAGVVHVLVNGVAVIESGRTSAALPGRVLRRAGHRDQ
jgi:N-acyl-D-aspartate/D-glutamate deacylase